MVALLSLAEAPQCITLVVTAEHVGIHPIVTLVTAAEYVCTPHAAHQVKSLSFRTRDDIVSLDQFCSS